MTPQILEDRLIRFASRIIDLSESLPKSQAAQHIGRQLLRSGTSPALNYGEAQVAESRADFKHKMKICLKELKEAMICLKLIDLRRWDNKNHISPLKEGNSELIAIFISSIKSVSKA